MPRREKHEYGNRQGAKWLAVYGIWDGRMICSSGSYGSVPAIHAARMHGPSTKTRTRESEESREVDQCKR